MRRFIHAQAILAFVLLFATLAVAQNDGKVEGQIMDRNGAPYANVAVTIKNPDNGFSKALTADKAGKFTQIGLVAGTYYITVTNEKDKVDFTQQIILKASQALSITIDLKEVAAEAAASPEVKLFNEMKGHFDAGLKAMADAADARKQLASATADQKSPLQDRLQTDYQTAITELDLAEKGTSPKDPKNHSVVLANLAQAYDSSKRYDDAVGAYQKAIDLQPSAGLYSNLSTSQVNAALALKDTAAVQQKLTDAGADCDKALALDPVSGPKCWKNIGIVLSNAGRMQESVAPLQKATQADPKDAQSWFLLGGSLTALVVPKQVGDKLVADVSAPTDAYQKCIDAAPTGPYAAQAKTAIDELAVLNGGVSTVEGQKSAPKKKR